MKELSSHKHNWWVDTKMDFKLKLPWNRICNWHDLLCDWNSFSLCTYPAEIESPQQKRKDLPEPEQHLFTHIFLPIKGFFERRINLLEAIAMLRKRRYIRLRLQSWPPEPSTATSPERKVCLDCNQGPSLVSEIYLNIICSCSIWIIWLF
jgi:hypothetical protein